MSMLSLTRKVGKESSESGNDTLVLSVPGYPPIRIIVGAVRGRQVKLVIDADPLIRIDRAEILRQSGATLGG